MTDPTYSEYLKKRAIAWKAHKLYLKNKIKEWKQEAVLLPRRKQNK